MHTKHVITPRRNQKPTRRIQSHGNGLDICLVIFARRAVVATPPGGNIRNALAFCQILARPFTLPNVRQLPRRVFDVFLSGTRVALDLGANLHPYAAFGCTTCCYCCSGHYNRSCVWMRTYCITQIFALTTSKTRSYCKNYIM